MIIVPESVPKDLIQNLEACQKQLRILIANYQILRDRSKVNPNDKVVPAQIDQIEKLILQYNERQMPTIEKIREIIKLGEHVQEEKAQPAVSKSSEDEDSPTVKTDDEKPVSEEEILESLGLKDVARTTDGKIDHSKLAMKDRMAIVRGMRRKRKRLNNGSKKSSPEEGGDDEEEEEILDESIEEGNVVDNALYKGFVTEIEPFDTETPELFDDHNLIEIEKKRRRLDGSNTDLDHCDQNQFLCSLNLFRPVDVSSIVDLLNEDAQKKLNYRNLTYIPELSDKKHKISYTYLAPDINSPPLLRTRQRRTHHTDSTAVSSRLTSRSNSRATTPERSITRQLSSASNESSNLEGLTASSSKKEEKSATENELNALTIRLDELQTVLAANKRTISTRKERSRLSEVGEEANQLETRIAQLKKILASMK